MLNEFKLDSSNLAIIPPSNYFDFLKLEANAKVIMTDSGGVQEEACIMCVPCVTLRDNTERPETISVGANRLVGTDPKAIVDGVRASLDTKRTWVNPFGGGNSGDLIIKYLLEELEK